MTTPLLLIEDNEMLGSTLVDNFQMENYRIDWIKDGKEGYEVAKQELHSLIILDIMLPNLDGFEILKRLRQTSQVPVLILSAKTQIEDKLQGLQLQADDYLTKPFQFKELLLRVQTILRRSQVTPQDMVPLEVSIGKASFDLRALQVKTEHGTENLSEREASLLRLLLTYKNQVVSREKILDAIWGAQKYPSSRTIDNFIVTLRKWIEIDPANPHFIISHRGIGYSLQLKDEI